MTENNEPEDVNLYKKIISRTEELLESGRKNLDEALKRAGDELSSAGSFTRKRAEKISTFVKRDIQHVVENTGKAKEAFKKAVDPKRVTVGTQSIFSKVLLGAADKLSSWAKKSEPHPEFKTGEVTSPGILICKNCGEEIHMEKTARIPPCPKCHKTLFRKSY